MDTLDFLSSSPELSIFQNRANKTKFGGILFLLYMILMLFISLLYILDYILKEDFDIECNNYNFFNPDDNKELNKIPKPIVDFTIKVIFFDIYEDFKDFSERLFLKINKETFQPSSYIYVDDFHKGMFIFDLYNQNISESNYIKFIYKCKEFNCSDIHSLNPRGLYFETDEFTIDNYAKVPFKKNNIGSTGRSTKVLGTFNNNSRLDVYLTWESIVYEEKKVSQNYLINYLIFLINI